MAGNNVFLYQNQIPDNVLLSHHRNYMSEVPLHWHNFVEIELVLEGRGEHIHNGISSTLKRGCVSVFRINDYHAIKNPENLYILSIAVKDSAISEKMLTQLNSSRNIISLALDDETFNTVLLFCEACIKENSSNKRNDNYIKNLLECILILLLRLTPEQAKPIKKHRNDQLNAAVSYLHNHFRENPSLSTIANIAHYSPTHFSHVFHQKIGESYNDYLNELKISYAKQLLTTTNLKVIDVGYQSGFNSYNNFYSTFKQYTTLSPAEYKKKKATNVNSMGYSWRFALCDTDIKEKPAYVYIKTEPLEGDTEYTFSYCYSYDYIIDFHLVQNMSDEKALPVLSKNSVKLNDKRRTNRVTVTFKTDSSAQYRLILIMGKGLNNINCAYRHTVLSDLTLYKTTESQDMNLAKSYTFQSGNVSWSNNSDAYDAYIDK